MRRAPCSFQASLRLLIWLRLVLQLDYEREYNYNPNAPRRPKKDDLDPVKVPPPPGYASCTTLLCMSHICLHNIFGGGHANEAQRPFQICYQKSNCALQPQRVGKGHRSE